MVTVNKIATLISLMLITVLTLLFTPPSHAEEIQVALDRNPVSINDSFQLTFTAADSPDDDPDFQPLEKDFEILNRQQSNQSSWVNGQFSSTIQWTLTLMAKHTGNLLIPAIRFGNDITQPMSVTVTPATAAKRGNDELFLEVEAAPEHPFVQSQVIYTVRFYHRVRFTQASLSEPELDNAVVEKLNDDSKYNTSINGVNYSVIERKYAIFPQKSGRVTIAPLVLSAQVVNDTRSRFNGFFSSQVTQTKRISSRTVTLNVQAEPDNFKGRHWLPAEELHVEQKWSNDQLRVKVGEPLTRTLTIVAKGTAASQLPKLTLTSNNAPLKTYPDQPVLKERKNNDGLISLREDKIAFIPSEAGNYQLPAIEIPWFNTKTQQTEIARIPAVTLTAVAATQPTAAAAAPVAAAALAESQKKPGAIPPSHDVWMWSSVFLGTGWLLTLLLMLIRRPRKAVEEKTADNKPLLLKEVEKALRKACQENDPQGAKQALIQWGKIHYNTTSLGAIAPFCEARLRDEIQHLNECLYAAEKNTWSGTKLFQAFSEHNARKQIKPAVEDTLEPLYRI